MKQKIIFKLIGSFLIADGVISFFYFGFDNILASLVRLVRAGIGAYLIWRFK